MEKEKLYNFKEVIAFSVIGLNNYLKSANKNNVNINDFARLFMEPLEKLYKKKNLIKNAEKLKEEEMKSNEQIYQKYKK